MIEIGNWVRVSIIDCNPKMECGHEKRHHTFNGRVGTLERDHIHGGALRCFVCMAETTDTIDHVLGVCFEGEHAYFKSSELEDLGIDLMALVPAIVNQKATSPIMG